MPLLSPETLLLSFPSFFINILGKNEWQYTIFGQHYAAILSPFIIISTIYALSKITKWFKKKFLVPITIFILICSFTSFFGFGLNPIESIKYYKNEYEINKDRYTYLKEITDLLPDDTTILSQYHLTSHLTKKGLVYRSQDQFRYVNGSYVFGTNILTQDYPKYVIIDIKKPFNPIEDSSSMFQILEEHNYSLEREIGYLALFERKKK